MCYQLAIASCQIRPRLRLLSLIRALNLARNDIIPAENIRADEECMTKLEMHDKLLLYSPIIPPHAAYYSLIFFSFFERNRYFATQRAEKEKEALLAGCYFARHVSKFCIFFMLVIIRVFVFILFSSR